MRIEYETELYHHGIKGMKWFRRRFQNEDGSYTALGKLRYGIGQKARERANTMSEWSRQHTSKAAANASKIGSDGKYKHQHMISPVNARRARQAMTDHDTEAIRNMGFKWNADKVLGSDYARKTASEIADKRLESRSRQVSGREDSLRSDAKLYEQQGGVSKPKEHWTGREAYEVRMRSTDSKHAQADRMFERQMAQRNNQQSSTLGQRATNALSTAGDLANKYGRQALAGAKGAAAAGLVAKNGLQLRAQDLAGRAGNAARSTSNEMREILKAYGKDIKGNAGNYINKARNAADLARTAVGVAGLGVREAAGRLGNRARDAAGYARTAAGVAGLDAREAAGRLGNRVKAGATQGAVNAILAGRQAARLARGAKRMYNDSDLALQVQGAKNLAGNYARIAKDSVGAAGRSARNAIAGISGEDVLRGAQGAFGRTALGVYNGANRAGREAKTTVGALRNLAGVYGDDAMNRARSMRDNAVQRYVQYAYQKSADDPYKYKREVSPVDARRNEIANRMLNKGPQTSMTGRTVNDYQREMIERAQRSANTAHYQNEMVSRAQTAQPRREQSGYMDRIQALQNANRYRADIAAAGGTRQSANPALALGQAARSSVGIANSRAGNLSAGASAAARRGFNGYKNEHPNSEMSFEEYKRKYGWMYGGV